MEITRSRTQTPQLARCRALLTALSVNPDGLGLAALEASIALQSNGGPPYPPVDDLPAGIPVTEKAAVAALGEALSACTEPDERDRLVEAAFALSDAPRLP